MYTVLLIVLGISIIFFMAEAGYVVAHLSAKIHTYLFLYIMCCLVNNVGYVMEMTAKSSEAAYTATRLLYLGKINIAYVFLVFILQFCKVRIPKRVPLILFVFHQMLYGIVLTNDWHHLYYSSITFSEEGLFPHNVYCHGPVYYLAMLIPYVYLIFNFVLLVKTYKKLKTAEEKKQMLYLIAAPAMSLIGTLVFFTGKTGGFDTGNIGLIFSAWFMFMALFRYKLIDTVDIAKNTLADSLEDGLIAMDVYDNVAYVNDIARELFPDIADSNPGVVASVVDVLTDKITSKEMIKSGEKSYIVRAKDLYQGELYRGRMYTIADVTETVKYTEQIERERDRADEANAAKSQFLSNMSHEIRTPMNAVVGMTDILLREKPKEPDASYLEIIKSSGNALLDIINDILDFSKIESGKMEIVNGEYSLYNMINELKMIFTTRVGEKPIRMIYEIDEKLPAVLYGDSVRVRQIIINIVNNAIKFTDSGYVKIKVDSMPADTKTTNLNISVQDTGQGIREEDKDKLFESFTRINSQKNHATEGTGLGLTITKQLVELMGGSISVDSTYGEGTTFAINLPQTVIDATYAKDVVRRQNDNEVQYFEAPDAKILLVEDSGVNVRVAKGLLKPLKLQIDVAENGLIALEKVTQKKYDIILMDHMMPVMDGIEASKKIREMNDEYYKRVPIIALTANAITGAKEEFLEAGMNDFVSKPIKINDILLALRKWMPQELITDQDGQ